MSSPTRHRRATVAFAALVAGAPSLVSTVVAAGPALAPRAPVHQRGPEIAFDGGGFFGVRCSAEPASASMTVPPESTLRVVNNTGRRARLLLDGVPQGEIAGRTTAKVLFHRGPVSLALAPICLFAREGAVEVEVSAAPTGQSPAGPPTRPGVGSESASAAATRTSSAVRPGTAEGGAVPPDLAGRPAAELAGRIEPLGEGGPVGLLALLATVCVTGVSAGAIRAIAAQRASRAIMA